MDGNAISFYSNMGKVLEVIKMTRELAPMENIEDWLVQLELIMTESVKRECERTNTYCITENKFEVDMEE